MTSTADLLARTAQHKVRALMERLLRDDPGAVRDLAVLRRSTAGVGSEPEAWEVAFADVPAALVGRDDHPSPAELALHTSLAMFAVHQQSSRHRMHQPGVGLGDAVRRLHGATAAGSTISRFKALGSASSWDETVHHLRSLVTQLRADQISLDYGLLARDLYRLQDPRTSAAVRRRWGRDLHRESASDSTPDSTPDTVTASPLTTGPAPTDPTGAQP